MITAVDRAIVLLQTALFTRELYGSEHRQVAAQIDEAIAAFDGLLRNHEAVTVVALPDRVICGDHTLPSSMDLLGGIFARLATRGLDSITIRRGLARAELVHLTLHLVMHGDVEQNLDTAHVEFGHISSICLAASGEGFAGPIIDGSGHVNDVIPILDAVWGQLQRNESAGEDLLWATVSEISIAASISSGSMIPLARLKAHDEYTFVHTVNVGILASALGEAVGLSGDMLHDLTLAALLHDIGKAAMPLDVLNKPGKLTEAEIRTLQQHPVIGAELLLGRPDIPDVAAIVAYEHHMHITGGGYPRMPARWRLSTASQIVHIADVFDALRTHRPYRAALSREKSLEIMREDAGTAIDPTLFDVFVDKVVDVAEAGREQSGDEMTEAA